MVKVVVCSTMARIVVWVAPLGRAVSTWATTVACKASIRRRDVAMEATALSLLVELVVVIW